MSKLDMDALVEIIIESGMGTMEDLAGFSEEDIAELEKKYNVRLPLTYKEFLDSIGYSGTSVFSSVIMVYPSLDEFRDSAYEMVEEDEYKLPSSSFVFLLDDNYFLFFDTESGDDPPVYKYSTGSKAPELFYDSFSEWLTRYVKAEAELESKYGKELRARSKQ